MEAPVCMTFARFVSVSRSRLARNPHHLVLLLAKLGDVSEFVSVARNVYSTEKEALRHPKPLSAGDPNVIARLKLHKEYLHLGECYERNVCKSL